MAYKIDDIKKDLSAHKMILLSEKYKNLFTPLEVKCDVCNEAYTITYDQWRKFKRCPICFNNPPIQFGQNLPPKKNKRSLALDLSTRATGWAIFEEKTLMLAGTRRITSISEIDQRIFAMSQFINDMIKNYKIDRVVIEDIQLQRDTLVYKNLAKMQGAAVVALLTRSIQYEYVTPSQWRSFCNIKSKVRSDQKREAILLIKKWYDLSLSEDACEAICIGRSLVERNENRVFGA